jgi:hypothetical protein
MVNGGSGLPCHHHKRRIFDPVRIGHKTAPVRLGRIFHFRPGPRHLLPAGDLLLLYVDYTWNKEFPREVPNFVPGGEWRQQGGEPFQDPDPGAFHSAANNGPAGPAVAVPGLGGSAVELPEVDPGNLPGGSIAAKVLSWAGLAGRGRGGGFPSGGHGDRRCVR